MSKDRRALGAEPVGEFVGITRLSRDLFALMMELALPRLADDPMLEYEVDGLVALAAAAPLPCTRIDDLLWAEIDDAGQLLRARTVTYPAIVRRDGPDPGLSPSGGS
jgi:choline kinase